ncbi:MAG: transcription elongation factor GreA [Gammaproteobacteria bacterium]|nr:transcription elongation factor GreA [Gammaproteobacteria bacterium]
MTRILLTASGAEKLRDELKRLKSEERPKIIQAIAEARAHGDLSENAEYDAAKNQQGFVEGRIAVLEGHLSIAEIIDPTTLNVQGRVVFGAHVELFDAESETEVSYQIVGDLEADLVLGQISVSSPIGRALIGKEIGEEVDVETPGGIRCYEILGVRYE